MRMHCLLFTATLAVVGVGCAKPVPVGRVPVLSPGREMRLAFRCEMQMAGAAVMETRIVSSNKADMESSSTLIRREETPYTSVEWGEMELPVSVVAMPFSGSLRVTMTVQRFRSGNTSAEKGQKKHEESPGFEAGDTSEPASQLESRLRDAKFIAVIDPQGRLASSDVTGEYWAGRKKELADAVKQGASQAQADMALRWDTPGVFAAMEDAMAYLPPKGVQAGQSWTVRREYVLPYNAYGFYMLTNGCSYYSKEEATCTVQSVKARGPHSIATIAIRGKRLPHDPEPGMPQRVEHFELKGELEANLNTGAIEKLRIESVPTWVRPKEETLEVKFVEVITLKPI